MPMMKNIFSSAAPLVIIVILSISLFWSQASNTTQVTASAQVANGPVIQNGGFEQGFTGWAHEAFSSPLGNAGGGLVAVTDEKAHNGSYSLKIASSINQQAYFYQYIDFPNTSYTFSFWLFRVDPKSWTACYLAREWDGNTIRPVSTLVIQDNTIGLNAWDNPYSPGSQVFNYDVTVGSWHKVTFVANGTSKTQEFYIDGNLIENLTSSSGNVFSPEILIFGDVSSDSCNGTFYFDDFELNALAPASPPPLLHMATLTTSCSSMTGLSEFQVEIRGNLSFDSTGLAGIPISISYSVTLGNSWVDLTSVFTDSEGGFFAVWQPSVTGNYLIKSTWAGNDTFSSVSTVVSLVVSPAMVQDNQTVFSVVSNSTVSDLFFNSTSQELSFSVRGSPNSTGYADVYISKSLIADISTVKTYLDGNPIGYTFDSVKYSWLIHVTYHHSTHTVVIGFGIEEIKSFPETVVWEVGGICGIAAVLAIFLIVVLKTKKK